jgi:hypothetical protein
MEAKHSLTLSKEFIEYCNLNDIKDIEKFAKQVFETGFTVTKFGVKPGKTDSVKLPPPARKIKEGKKLESKEEYQKRWDKKINEQKKLYEE